MPGRYIDRPEPADRNEPLQRQKAEDIEVKEAQDFSPIANGSSSALNSVPGNVT
jgi:hypothetical protein